MATVLGLRHAVVDNPGGLVYGRLPGFPLSATGLEEARRLGRMLAGAGVSAVYASPLERAVQTAEALAAPHGLPVRVEGRLTEWIGDESWQGMVWDDLVRTEAYIRLGADPLRHAPHEPLDRVGEEVLAWARDAAAGHGDGGTVLGVSHEAPLAAAYLVGRGAPVAGYRTVHIPHLSGIRLEPGPPETVDPVEALLSC
ncbi:MAG: histidine phosphatase family protein [Actinobacteria bacterium]|nr:histidine phosphatase family protein [Actinomycetota bacterium]